MFAKLRLVIGWALVAVLVIFVVANWEKQYIDLLVFGGANLPLGFALLLSAALGAGAVYAFQFLRGRKKQEK
jgi:uncharacterized integral membrane protein